MIDGFKKFIMGGNVVDLAVGIVVGAAFASLVDSFGSSFLEPLIAAVMGGGDSGGTFEINDQVFNYGAFITAIITFLITMVVLYLVVVTPMNAIKERRKASGEEPEDPTNEEKMLALLEQIAKK